MILASSEILSLFAMSAALEGCEELNYYYMRCLMRVEYFELIYIYSTN